MKKILFTLLLAIWLIQPNFAQSYDGVDCSPEAQRRMAEARSVKLVFRADNVQPGPIPLYTAPSTESKQLENNPLTVDAFYDYKFRSIDDSKPGWFFIVDLDGKCPSGWVESKYIELEDGADVMRVGDLVTLNLGANVPQIMERWGPGTIVDKETIVMDEDEESEGEEEERETIERTVMSFNGLELTYQDAFNFSFTLTREGSGMGGIFIGAPWCDQEYIEKTFGQTLTIDKEKKDNGLEVWRLSFVPDGWDFYFVLTFDQNGLVREFKYSCYHVNLMN